MTIPFLYGPDEIGSRKDRFQEYPGAEPVPIDDNDHTVSSTPASIRTEPLRVRKRPQEKLTGHHVKLRVRKQQGFCIPLDEIYIQRSLRGIFPGFLKHVGRQVNSGHMVPHLREHQRELTRTCTDIEYFQVFSSPNVETSMFFQAILSSSECSTMPVL